MKKYDLTNETMEIGTITLHRIKALVAFADVDVGELGGWVEKESNIDQDGDAWVSDDAIVSGDARVCDNARVSGNARVYGNAWVYGDARVYGNAWVSGNDTVISSTSYLCVCPIGSRNDALTFTRDKNGRIFAKVGRFTGDIGEFRAKVKETHGENIHAKAYLLAAQLAEERIDTTPIEDDKGDGDE